MPEPGARLLAGHPPLDVTVQARSKWNATGLRVRPGERYELRAEGTWTDLFIPTDADGYTSDDAPRLSRWFLRRFESRRRVPHARWFCLVGCIGKDGEPFVIGKGREWTVSDQQSGALLCYANDVATAYWNNRGAVWLLIRRLGPAD